MIPGKRESMVLRRLKWSALFFALSCVVALACTSASQDESDPPPMEQTSEQALLRAALTFYASFDHGVDADFALGDPILYTAPSWDESDQAQPGVGNPDVEIVTGLGRFGDALRFNRRNTSAIFYRAQEKVAYSEEDWSGSVSFWLSLSPSEDLAPGYCDPIQITDQAYNDAAVWVDFTDADPRQFRLGVFGDLDAWNPERLSSDEHPGFEQGLVAVDEPPFRRGARTHVVVSFSGLGSASGGVAALHHG